MQELLARLAEVADLRRAEMLLAWDQEVCMPADGADARADLMATVGRLAHERFADDRVGELLADAAPRDELEADVVRVVGRDHAKARRVSADLVAEMAQAGSVGRGAWLRAREAGDFALFADALERNIELRWRYSACFPEAEHVYDLLLDEFEPGASTTEVRAALERLRAGLVPLVAAASEADGALARDPVAEDGQRRLARRVLDAVGAGGPSWRSDDAVHPFAAALAPGDVRITVRYGEDGLESLFGALHEFGHGLYEHQVDPALARTLLGEGASSAWHESQSRLWENMVGRSEGFWRWCFDHLRACVPEPFARHTWREVHRAANVVRPTLVRVSADEVTYGLHIVLRFELELELIAGELGVADLPAAWNERTRAYLGLDVPDDVAGVLQDIHWAEGLFGYFPTYALGNVIAGQVWAVAGRELPELEEQFAAGDFAALREWLGERVHRHGRRLMPGELMQRVVGGPLDPAPYLAYLEGKVRASDELMS